MSRSNSVIEINGTNYDAATGNIISSAKKSSARAKDQSRVIDGFVRKSSSPVKATVKPKKTESKPARQVRNATKVHSRTQKSKALMRTVVSKPKADVANAAKTLIKPSLSKVVAAEQERRSRANAIVKDSRVKKFAAFNKPATASSPKRRRSIVAEARPMGMPTNSAQAAPAPLPSMVVSASHQRLERMLDEALVKADAHKQMLKAKSRNPLNHIGRLPRWLVIGAVLLVAAIITGLVLWRSMPAVAIKVASKEAHVNAVLPSYAPTGFSVATPISHTGGAVTVKYHSATNTDYGYDITQKSSSWDSSSLAANVLNQPNSQIQTSQVQGTTVYIYGSQSNATWVNNGIWYTLKNNASLTSDEILHIVQSM